MIWITGVMTRIIERTEILSGITEISSMTEVTKKY